MGFLGGMLLVVRGLRGDRMMMRIGGLSRDGVFVFRSINLIYERREETISSRRACMSAERTKERT